MIFTGDATAHTDTNIKIDTQETNHNGCSPSTRKRQTLAQNNLNSPDTERDNIYMFASRLYYIHNIVLHNFLTVLKKPCKGRNVYDAIYIGNNFVIID